MKKKSESDGKDARRPRAGKKLKTSGRIKARSPRLSGEIELLGMRVASAESLLKKTSEQASRAKRRRKLAKLLYKRARKHAKHAEENLKDARAALNRAMATLVTGHRRQAATPRAPRAKPVVDSPRAKKSSAPRQKRRNRSRRVLPAPATPNVTPVAIEPIDVAQSTTPSQDPDLNTTTETNDPIDR